MNTLTLLYCLWLSAVNIVIWYFLWQNKKANEKRIKEVKEKFQIIRYD